MTKKKINWKIVCTGLICLTALECVAMFNSIDGVLLTTVVGIIAATMGVTYNKLK